MSDLSINLHTPLWRGMKFTRSLAAEVNNWNHTIRAVGGYWDADYEETINIDDLGDYLQNALGSHVVVKDDALVIIWEGFINKLTITLGRLSFVIGPLMDAINRTYVEYTLVDTITGVAAAGEPLQTEWGDNFDAQDKYGIIEKMLSATGLTQATAVQMRDAFLATEAWPEIANTITPGGNAVNVKVKCFGYVRWLDRITYSQTAYTGDVFLHEKLKNILLSEPNGFFEQNDASYTTELLENGNFEIDGAGGDDIFADWIEHWGNGYLIKSATDHKEGANCCEVGAESDEDTYVYQDITVVPRQAYRLSFWSKDTSQITITGTHAGPNNSPSLVDFYGDKFSAAGARTGQTIYNITDDSSGLVEGMYDDRLEVTLTGGADNDWDIGDSYTLVIGAEPARYQIYDLTNGEDIVSISNVSESGWLHWRKKAVVFYAPAGCTTVRIYLWCTERKWHFVKFDAVSCKEWSAALASNSTLVPAYEDRVRTSWAVIRELLGYGDYLSRAYNWGIYADRRVSFGVVPEVEEYLVSVSDVGRGYTTLSGSEVKEYNLLPGKWLLITDVLVGEQESNLRRNPRAMFIEIVKYNAQSGATLNPGKFGTIKQDLARLGLLEL